MRSDVARLLLLPLALLLAAATPDERAQRLAAALADLDRGRAAAARPELEQLAQEGSGVAETMLGAMHARGLIGRVDTAAAAAYWYRAAQRGYAPAQLALARALADGVGVARSRVDAYRWALIAGGHADAPVRAEAMELAARLRTGLDDGEAAGAAKRAKTWRPWAALGS